MLRIYPNRFESEQVVPAQPTLCFFEINYLAKRLSHVWQALREQGMNVAKLRYELGLELLKEHPPLDGINFVTHIPKSPIDAAHAYADASGLPRMELFYKINDDRSFMHPETDMRISAINENLFVNHEMEPERSGSNFLAIDDSIIRLTNGPVAKRKAEERGFRMRQLLSYTPIIGGNEIGIDLGCEHGIDMPRNDNFVASRVGRDPSAIARELGVDYVGFLSVGGLINVFERYGVGPGSLCLECVTAKTYSSTPALSAP
jgi:glutamine phosphoribosylpyrophosphate amidotransferase